MPVGNPKASTIASQKSQAKKGWIAKSYKLRREIVEDFADACDKAGVSAAGQLTKMMKAFIEEVNRTE